jgi:mono/diheme cytochrome c family protein
MLGNIGLWLVLLLVTVALGWLAVRAFRSRQGLVKWLGGGLASLFALFFGLVGVVSGAGLVEFYAPRGQPVQALQVARTPEQIARGEHLANAFCVECHSPTGELPMIGGVDLGKDLSLPLGSFISVNLTPAGPLKDWTDGEILRVLREGVDRNGQPLVMMSAVRARNMSDEDLHAIIAYLRSQPAAGEPTPEPPDRPNLLGAIMLALNLAPSEPPVTGPISAPPKAATAEYGEYLVSFQDCTICHGPNLGGNPTSPLVEPDGPNLRIVKGWTAEEFVRTIRTGVDPSGHELLPVMPWRTIARLDDTELNAIYAYLVSLP